MYRPPNGPQQSPGEGRGFVSPPSGWGFHRSPSPYGGSGHRGRSGPYSPCSPGFHRGYSPGPHRGYSPGPHRGYSPGPHRGYSPRPHKGYSDGSPVGFGNGSGGQKWRQSGGWRRPMSVSPASRHRNWSGSSDSPVEKYFNPTMLQDPWAGLKPVSAADLRDQQQQQQQQQTDQT